jgi:hypothetical protein
MFAVDPLHLAIALGPLAMYLLALGAINLSSRPLVTSGTRDAAALAIAVSGLVVAGPMELFMVEGAARFWGSGVWVILLSAYALAALLLILMLRPRLIVYNATLEQLRPLLAEIVAQLDPEARWVGESVVLPQLGVQFHLDAQPMLKNVQLVASGPNQSIHGWRLLERVLAAAMGRVKTGPNPAGLCWILLGVLACLGITWYLAHDPAGVTQAMNDMLRR